MTDSNAIFGGCHCGAVRYMATASPAFSIICCCTQCQKITGAGHAPQFALARATVTLKGKSAHCAFKADSGNTVESSFCQNCGGPRMDGSPCPFAIASTKRSISLFN